MTRRGPRRVLKPVPGHRTIGVHLWADTAAALDAYADEHGLYVSGAAHILLRQALGLPSINTDTN